MKIHEFISFVILMFISCTALFVVGFFSLVMISAYNTYKFVAWSVI